VRTLVDVGNQSSRVIKVTESGRVADFLFSDKCAAGSGRILQIISRVLGVKIEELGELSVKSHNPVKFTTGCAVFLETEAISRIAEGNPQEDIAAGLHKTLASKICAMIHRMRLEEDCAVTGGGAKDKGFVTAMEKMLGKKVLVPDEPLITGAIGAALIAKERSGT
jgi:predicted CoA-substrate-specific enzyme activase